MCDNRIVCLFVVVSLFTACTNSGDHNSRSVEMSASPVSSQAPKDADSPTSVTSLRIVQRNDSAVLFELRNDSDRQIFLSHVPAEHDGTSKFVSYSLERKANGEFGAYGEGFHHLPNLHHVDPKQVIQFHLVGYPRDTGEYRVRVGYYEDEEVYKMISQRLAELTDAEKIRVDQSRKYVFSDSFFVSKPPAKN